MIPRPLKTYIFRHKLLPASKRNHRGCLVVCFSYVWVEVVFHIEGVFLLGLELGIPLGHVSLGLNQLAKNQVVKNGREDLGNVGCIKYFCEHPTCPRYHEITRKYRIASPIYLMRCYLWPSLICSVNYIVLKQACIMSNFDAGWESFDLSVVFGLIKFLLCTPLTAAVVNGSRQEEHDGRAKILPL
jgi:hypothetical protein